MDRKKVIVLAGATGRLGNMIAHHLLELPEVGLHCVVRSASEKTDALKEAGAKIFTVDFSALDEAKNAFQGAQTVVSALRGGEDVIVGVQLELYKAAMAAGARTFIPSDFSSDIFSIDYGDNWFIDLRKKFTEQANALNGSTRLVHVLNGCFLDRDVLFGFLGAFDLKDKRACYWGSGDVPMDFTTYDDAARYTALAAATDQELPRKFNIAGDQMNFHQLVGAVQKETGVSFEAVRLGSLEDLDATITQRMKENPNNPLAFIPLMYYRFMLNGKGKLDELGNSMFPEVHPTTVHEYVREHIMPMLKAQTAQ